MGKDSSRRLISLIEHHAILLAWLSFWITSTEVTGDKIRCSIPPVVPLEDTVLTCSFPEDVNATKKDFTVYHYVEHSSPDAILDCWWIRGSLDCFEKQGFRYNKMVNTSLNMTVASVTSAYTGRYACQAAGYGSSSLETCELQFKYGKENMCSVKVFNDTSSTPAYLTCLFNEDIQKTHRNLTVYEYIGESRKGVVECWWDELSRLECRTEGGYRLDGDVSSYIKVELPNRRKEAAVSYSCWDTGSIADHQETCSLPEKNIISYEEDLAFKLALGLGLPIGMVAVVLLVYLLVIVRRSRRRRKKEDEVGQPLMNTKKTPENTQRFQDFLTMELTATYPSTYNRFYFVPPLYFNKTRCKKQSVGADFVFILDPCDPLDVRHDRAMQHVIHCLRHVAEQGHEPMFVLTQFQYKDYLNNPGSEYKRHCLPMPAGLKGGDKHVGCLDFLIVHREHGVLVGVVKAVSEEDVEGEDNEHKNYEAVVAQVADAVQQFRKAKSIIIHLLSDQADVPTVRHSLVLPNLTISSLQRALDKNSALFHDLQECLESEDPTDCIKLCVCAEDLSDANRPWEVKTDGIRNFRQKWKWSDADQSKSSHGFYTTILTRFFGPATQSFLRVPDGYEGFDLPKTLADAVSLTGDLYGRTMVTPEIMELLDKPKVFLLGKPNTGKTRMMALAGSNWLASGHDVVVVKDSSAKTDPFLSQHLKSLKTASNTQSTAEGTYGHVYDEECNFKSQKAVQETIESLKTKYSKKIFFLLDAAHLKGTHIVEFCESLDKEAEDLHLWVSCTGDLRPPLGYERYLPEIQSCPPVVVREAAKDKTDFGKHANTINAAGYLAPTDGPPVKHIYHTKQHSAKSPHECLECGKEAGSFIAETLLIKETAEVTTGILDSQKTETFDDPRTIKKNKAPRQAVQTTSMKFRDILIVFEFSKFWGKPDIKENHTFVKALKDMGIKVQVVDTDEASVSADDNNDTAKALHVRHMQTYRPKRKIVVYVEADSGHKDDENKLRALTSCTSQLILVHAQQQ